MSTINLILSISLGETIGPLLFIITRKGRINPDLFVGVIDDIVLFGKT